MAKLTGAAQIWRCAWPAGGGWGAHWSPDDDTRMLPISQTCRYTSQGYGVKRLFVVLKYRHNALDPLWIHTEHHDFRSKFSTACLVLHRIPYLFEWKSLTINTSWHIFVDHDPILHYWVKMAKKLTRTVCEPRRTVYCYFFKQWQNRISAQNNKMYSWWLEC